jgi:4'-phosphopantetheinyl transferase
MTTDCDILTVWAMELETGAADLVASWSSILEPEELNRAPSFHHEADRQTYVAAHTLARGVLSAVCGAPPRTLRLGTGDRGRPMIVSPERLDGLQFSLTHTDGLVACAVAAGFAFGLDAESRRRRKLRSAIADAVLRPSEIRLLRAAPAELRHEIFLKLWTLREAYAKATGQGIFFPYETVSFVLDPIDIRFPSDSADNAAKWQLFNWCTERHVLSLAAYRCKDRPLTVRRRTLAQDELSRLVA